MKTVCVFVCVLIGKCVCVSFFEVFTDVHLNELLCQCVETMTALKWCSH